MDKKGMSLIEIVTLIGIITIISAITVFSFSSLSPSITLSQDSKQLVADLRKAQQLAVTKQKNHLIRFNQANANYQLIKITDSTEEILNTTNLSTGISLSSIDLNPTSQEVKFNSAGSPSSSGTVTLANNKGKSKIIQIAPSGFVNIP
jgi:competence protein ComGD